MYCGFSKVVEKLLLIVDKDIGFIFKNIGMMLFFNVGGVSGLLFGIFFICVVQVIQVYQSLMFDELYLMICEGVDGVVNCGKVESGDKIMCDVWLLVVDFLCQFSEQYLLIVVVMDVVCEVVECVVYVIIIMQVCKGCVSYFGECSIGYQDFGVILVLFMVQMLVVVVKE